MGRVKMEVYDALFKNAFGRTAEAAAAVAAEKRLLQPKAEKAHPLWLMGHLAFGNDNILNVILFGGPRTVPREYTKLFGPHFIGGEPVTEDAGKYPSWDEVVTVYGQVAEATLHLLKEQVDADLDGAPKGKIPQGTESFFKTYVGTLDMMLLHDSYHRGQLGLLASL
ncbi:MAG TPA: DinB family protein [Candidatus Hydrogenedentes bacterium]|nr:DinB family protein [Candidatus Hydrogenedentota bacterium]